MLQEGTPNKAECEPILREPRKTPPELVTVLSFPFPLVTLNLRWTIWWASALVWGAAPGLGRSWSRHRGGWQLDVPSPTWASRKLWSSLVPELGAAELEAQLKLIAHLILTLRASLQLKCQGEDFPHGHCPISLPCAVCPPPSRSLSAVAQTPKTFLIFHTVLTLPVHSSHLKILFSWPSYFTHLNLHSLSDLIQYINPRRIHDIHMYTDILLN